MPPGCSSGASMAWKSAAKSFSSPRAVSAHLSGTPVVKPEFELWYDVSRKIGLTANVGYIVARPRMTITSSIGSESERLHADAWSITAGAVYRIW